MKHSKIAKYVYGASRLSWILILAWPRVEIFSLYKRLCDQKLTSDKSAPWKNDCIEFWDKLEI